MSGSGIDRRTVLKGLAAGATLVACGGDPREASPDAGSVDATTPPPDARPIVPPEGTPAAAATAFPLGISSGDLAGDRGVLWTRYAGSAGALAVIVWRMTGADHATYAEELAPITVTPADGGFVHAPVTGLAPGARYRYAFVELDGEVRVARSEIGRFRAPLAAGAREVITLGAVSCTKDNRPLDVLARAAERDDLDAFVLCGDTAYCDGATSLDDYRAKYVDHIGRAEHVALRARTALYATWDDHEVDNNWNPEDTPAAQVATATRAFFEHAPLARIAGAEDRIWRSARWGDTLELFVLDCRGERRPSTRDTAGAEYISPAQLAWLQAGLAASTAVFKVIVNSVPITEMPLVWSVSSDRWEAYAAQRTALLAFIDAQAITGVVWLAGDFHLAFISRVSASGPGATQREVLCGPGAQIGNPLVTSLTASRFSFRTATNNHTTLRFDPDTAEVQVAYHDGDGTAFHTESFVP